MESAISQLGGTLRLCAADAPTLTCAGRTFTPDASTAYAEVFLSHAAPVMTRHGEGLSPWTVRRSYASLEGKPVNRDHRMVAYDPERIKADAIIGFTAAVEYPWDGRLAATPDKATGIRCVVGLYKNASGMAGIIGRSQARGEYAVSMEVKYVNSESGFLIRAPGLAPVSTPADWSNAGWSYVPSLSADQELLATRDWKKSLMKGRARTGNALCGWYKGQETYWLMGGLDGQVHYAGIGWVKYGAEPTARVGVMLASDTGVAGGEDPGRPIMDALLGALRISPTGK